MSTPEGKNFRNGVHDVSPPTRLYNMPAAITGLRINSMAMVILPGPAVALAPEFPERVTLRSFVEAVMGDVFAPPEGGLRQ